MASDKKSGLTNLLEYLEYVTYQTDAVLSVNVIYLIFQKAFDKVPPTVDYYKNLRHMEYYVI